MSWRNVRQVVESKRSRSLFSWTMGLLYFGSEYNVRRNVTFTERLDRDASKNIFLQEMDVTQQCFSADVSVIGYLVGDQINDAILVDAMHASLQVHIVLSPSDLLAIGYPCHASGATYEGNGASTKSS